MLILYSQPNTLKLPYKTLIKEQLRDKNGQLVYNEDGSAKMIEKISADYFKFIPGKNIISKELWIKIVEYNREDMEHYSSILKIFKPITDKKTGIEVGEDDEKINLNDLSQYEMKDLIEHTMDINDIKRYEKLERKRDRARPSIMKAIKIRKAQISEADKVFQEKE